MLWVVLGASALVVVILALSWSRLHKWIGTTVSGQRIKYRDLLGMSMFELEEVLRRSIPGSNYTAASWAVQVLLRQYGPDTLRPILEEELKTSIEKRNYDVSSWVFKLMLSHYGAESAWPFLWRSLSVQGEHAAATTLVEVFLPSKRVGDGDLYHPSHCLPVVGGDFASSYQVGMVYLERAKGLVKVKGEKENMIWNKTNALRFLDKARERAQELDSVALAGIATGVAELEEQEQAQDQDKESDYVGLVAHDYDAALYLMWGTQSSHVRNE